jgi:predicted amidophosphoribosyltransferase
MGSGPSQEANEIVWYEIKRGEGTKIEAYVETILEEHPQSILKEFLSNAGALIPVPKHSLHQPGNSWVAERITKALQGHGIGEAVFPLLRRIQAVPRSSGVGPSSMRPTVTQHRDSLEVDQGLFSSEKVTLIDDVVTMGSTLLGCAAELRDINPAVQVQAFALCRTETGKKLNDLN